MVKIRRNRQPKDWSKQTNARTATGIISHAVTTKITKLLPVSQQTKVNKNQRRLRREIDFHKQERDKSGTTPERREYLENAIRKKELRLTKNIFAGITLQQQVEKEKEDYKTRQINLKLEMQQHILNAGKVRQGDIKYPNEPGRIESTGIAVGTGRIREYVDTVGGKRKIKRKYLPK
jgi:hypothetical protein